MLRKISFAFLLLCVSQAAYPAESQEETAQWASYGGEGGAQFTPLKQINASNLDRLEVAWTMRTGDLSQGFENKGHSFQANPILWDRTLYISTTSNWVVAVDALNGEERWRYDAGLPKEAGYSESASRGVSIWHGDAAECTSRILLGTLIGTLHALDARTGERCTAFGTDGVVDLSVGANAESIGDYGVTSPPAVMGDRLIVGSAIGDNREVQSERGIVRALDARSGALLWLWDPIPRSPEDPASASWEGESAMITGSANAWAPITVDEEQDLVFVSTSSPSPDFYGGERLGDNHYANSLVVLNGSTGEVVWHRQLVHHDVWDYDVPAQPTLTTLRVDGGDVPAVIVVTKTGMLFAFERTTGKPLVDITEVEVPGSDVPGERLSPTQPFSAIPALADQSALTEDDMFGLAIFDKMACARVLEQHRSEGIFTPPSLQGTVMNPSYAGGSNWGGVAVDQERQIAVTNVNQTPALVRLIPRDELDAARASGELDDWQISRMEGTPYFMARKIFLSPLGMPCNKPPWGKLVAVDLVAQDILWEVPLGTITDLAPALVPNFNWGVPNLGGALMTGSGLVVIGAAAEHALRIFDTTSGEILWETRMPAGPLAVPMSYELDGRQFIVVAAGGHGQLGLEPGDYVVAFALTDMDEEGG